MSLSSANKCWFLLSKADYRDAAGHHPAGRRQSYNHTPPGTRRRVSCVVCATAHVPAASLHAAPKGMSKGRGEVVNWLRRVTGTS